MRGHFAQIRIAHDDGGLRARREGAQTGVAAYGVPFVLAPARIAVSKAARLAEDGRHVAFAHGGFAHLPGAEENPVEARVLGGLFRGVEQRLVRADLGGVDVQILRKMAQIRHGAHPGRQISLAGRHLFAAAGREQQQTEDRQEEAKA